MRRADSLIIPLIRELGIKDDLILAEIKKNWYKIFNKPLSYHMYPFKFSNGEILINVDSPVWLQELNLRKEEILRKMNSYEVKSLRFRLGRVSTKPEVKSQKSEARKPTHEELSYIEDTVSKIDDEALRETVRRTIEKAITSNRGKARL